MESGSFDMLLAEVFTQARGGGGATTLPRATRRSEIPFPSVYKGIHIYGYTYIHIYMHKCIYVYLHMYVYMYTFMYSVR